MADGYFPEDYNWESYFKVLRVENDRAIGIYVDFRDRRWCHARLESLPAQQFISAWLIFGDCFRISPIHQGLNPFDYTVTNLYSDHTRKDLVAEMNLAAESSVFRGW